MRDTETIVREFCAAWDRRDVEAILAWFAPDATYHNMPLDPVRGHTAIREVLNLFVPPASSIHFEVLAVASRGTWSSPSASITSPWLARRSPFLSQVCSRCARGRSPHGATTSTWEATSARSAEVAQAAARRRGVARPHRALPAGRSSA